MSNVISIKELGHVVLYVRDLERSRAFYRDVLGFREVFAIPSAVAVYSSGRTHHELVLQSVGPDAQPIPQRPRVGMYHFALKVGDSDDELRAARDAVVAAGITIDGLSDSVVAHSLFVRDPDDNEVELYVDVPGVDWKNDPSVMLARPPPLQI
jgi:catechol-2,3-dioxygenase